MIYETVWCLIEHCLDVKDWEAGAAAIVALAAPMAHFPPDKDARSPMQLVKLCGNVTRPWIWQRVLQHLYCYYDHDDAIRDFLQAYLQNKEASFRDIAEPALERIRLTQ